MEPVICTVCKSPAVAVVRDGTRPVCKQHAEQAVAVNMHIFRIGEQS